MAISGDTGRMTYVGNGTADTFAFTFKAPTAADLDVIVVDDDGVETTLTLTTQYTVTGAGNDAGGSIALVYNAAWPWVDSGNDLVTGYTLVILPRPSLTQTSSYRTQQTRYSGVAAEQDLDLARLVDIAQQDQIDGALQIPVGETRSVAKRTLPFDRASKVLGFNTDKEPIAVAGIADAPATPFGASLIDDANATAGRTTLGLAPTDTAQWGAAQVIATGATTARTLAARFADIVYLKDFEAVGDGTTDDTTSIAAALASGAKVIFGSGLTYKTSAALTVPAGVIFRHFTIQMADSNYNALVISDDCQVDGAIIGTSRTNQHPSAQVGVFGSSKTRARLTVLVRNTNTGVALDGCTRCVVDAICISQSGQSGVSEGYGVLLYQESNDNRVNVQASGCARHALYISSGSSRNTCVCHSVGTVTNFSVQINSLRSQAVCSGNDISGSDYNSAGGVVIAMDTTGAADAGGAVRNNVVHDFEVTALVGTNLYPAFLLTMDSSVTTSYGNKFVRCAARGVFNSTSLGVIHLAGGREHTVRDCSIIATSANTTTGGFTLQATSGGGISRINGLSVDLLTSGVGVLGAYIAHTSGLYTFDDVTITCPAALKVFFSGSAADYRIGQGNVYTGNLSVTAVPATSTKTGTITLPSALLTNPRIVLTVSSQGTANNGQTQAIVQSVSGATVTVLVYNGHSAQQDVVLNFIATGLPG